MTLHDYSLVCATKRLIRRGAPCAGPGVRRCAACAAAQYGTLAGPPIAALAAISGRVRRRAADLLLPVSEHVARRCGLPGGPTPWEVIPNFLVDPGPIGAGVLPADLPDEPFMLYVGDLTADKGVDTLLRAHSDMKPSLPLVLIGRLLDATVPPSAAGVHAFGPLPHDTVLATWQRAAIGVAPSITPETFGLAALEAMRAGTPVVATRTGGLPEVVGDDSGILVAPGSAAELRGALERLAGDPALRERLSTGARARAERFSAAAVLPRVEAAYARAVDHRRERDAR